jgi:DNA-binding SARP family transcriptional activator
VEFRILGPVEVVGGDGSFSLPEGRGRALLTILALHPGRVVSTDRLIDQLWGETPPVTARTKLHGLVSTLRRVLEPDRRADADPVLLQTQPPGYVLAVDPDQVDALRFRRLVGTAAKLPAAEKARVLTEALELWRGPALADFTYAPFAQTEITSLEELRLSAIEDRITAELHLGRHTALVPDLEALIAENPFRERLRAQAMLAQYRSGNQQRALSIYRDAYNMFTEELGIEPGPVLQDLEEAILTHDPALDGMPAAVGGADGSEILEGRSVAETWLSESRKIVTVMYVDLRMPALARPDPEAHRKVTRRALGTIVEVLHRHGGTAQGSIGGVSVGVFGIPLAHEDDPVRGVRAALETIQALTAPDADGNAGPVARIGVNTGEIVVGDTGLGNSGLPEDTARVAGRLQQAADANEVLIGDRTRQLVSHAVTVEPVRRRILDDAGNPLTAWRLVEADPHSSGPAPPPDTPWVGRDTELTRLQQVFRSTVDSGRPQRVTLIGPAGIGKSRLASQFGSAIGGEARVLIGHCPPYGNGITFWPLREIIDQAGGDVGPDAIRRLLGSADGAESIANHVAGAVGSTEAPHRPEVLFPAIRRFIGALARERPLVLILEDLHWGQPTFIELIRYLTDSVEGPVVFLCLARPEFLDQRPSWPEVRDDTEILMLEPLDPDSVDQLVGFYLAKRGVSFDQAQQAIGAAEGNPLFIEQIMAAFGDHDQPAIPPSIQALLVARLDRLGPAERDLIRSASVLGRRFRVSDLRRLIPERARETVPSHLESLERRALIAEADEDDAFDFRHALIQLVSYQTLTKESRAKLHAQAGELLEQSGAGGTEVDEIVGYHFEQAFGYRSELGLDDDTSRRLGAQAAERLTRAGLRAFARFDVPAAENLLTRAEPLLPRHHSDWWTVVRRLAEVDQVMGRHDKAIRAFDRLIQEAESGGDEALEHFFRLERAWARIATGPDPILLETLEGEIGRGREVFEALGDDAGLAQIFRLMLHIHHRRGRMAEMEDAGRRDLEHAIKSGHPREVIGGQWLLAMAFEAGPRPVRECIEDCEGILHWRGTENPGVVSTMGYLWAMAGEFDTARRLAARAQQILRERVRARRPLGQVIRRAGDVELLAGDVEAAKSELRRALELNLEMGENDMVCQIAASVSRILGRRGEIDEAERLAAMSKHHAPTQSVTSQALWRSVQARVLSLHAKHWEARSLAQEAVELVPADMLNLRAEVSVDLGEVLLQVGHRDLGAKAIRDTIDLYRQKGNVAGAAQAEAILS